MEIINTLLILLTFGGIFYILYTWNKKESERDDKIRETFEKVLETVFTTQEKQTTKFYDIASKIEIEHFKQLEKSTDKQARFFEKQLDKFMTTLEEKQKEKIDQIERISSLVEEPNEIEKIQTDEDPLKELNPEDFVKIKNVQFDGEETIYPIA